MFYTDSLAYVNNFSQAYITQNVAALARAIEPAAVTLLSLYVILWGVASLRGMIEEPITDAAARIIKIALIFGIGIQLGHYNELVIDTFFNAPEQLAQALTGGASNASMINSLDQVFASGFQVGKVFWEKGGILNGDFGMYLVGFTVWLVTMAVTVYAAALIILAKIALTLIIIVGPLFIVSLLFQQTAGFFSSWIHQLANYSLLIFLVIGANLLIVTLFARATSGAMALSSTGQIEIIFPMLATGALSFLVLLQLPTVASGLAGGLSLSSQGIGHHALSALRKAIPGFRKNPTQSSQRDPNRLKKAQRDGSSSWSAYENRDQNSIGPG